MTSNQSLNHPDADIIIRSSDGVEYRTIKILLSLASPIFKDMLGLPRTEGSLKEVDEQIDGLPVVEFAEDSTTLQRILALCYPMSWKGVAAKPINLAEVDSLLEAAAKYEMEGAKELGAGWLVDPVFLAKEPLRVYTIACHHGLAIEATAAAKHTLLHPLFYEADFAELSSINAGLLQKVLRYHRRCCELAKEVLQDPASWITEATFHTIQCSSAEDSMLITSNPSRKYPHGRSMLVPVHPWLVQYMTNIQAGIDHFCSGGVAKESQKMAQALTAAGRCTCCSDQTSRHFPQFVEALMKEIDRRISSVSCASFASTQVT